MLPAPPEELLKQVIYLFLYLCLYLYLSIYPSIHPSNISICGRDHAPRPTRGVAQTDDLSVSRQTVQVVIYSPNRREIPEGIHGNASHPGYSYKVTMPVRPPGRR